jgi:acylphosphatase
VTTARAAAEILIEGRVQGVGFRDYALRRASRLGLHGYVMNLDDGRVRVHAEGARDLVEELARQLASGPPAARVERVQVRWLAATGRFTGFDIRYTEPR